MTGHSVGSQPTRSWNAPPPVPGPKGHYSQAVKHGDLVWISGLVGNQQPGLDAEQQARVALGHLREILAAGGLELDHVLTTTIHTTDPSLWSAVNAAYLDAFGSHRPARAIIPGAVFAGDCLLEIQAVAGS